VHTHQLRADQAAGTVTKTFAAAGRGEPGREWRALRLLAVHAPGLAPRPVRADLAARPPSVTMELLPGAPLRARPLTPAQTAALTAALTRLWSAVPLTSLARVAGERAALDQVLASIADLRQLGFDHGGDPQLRRAHAAGLDWLGAATAPGGPLAAGPTSSATVPVFGQGDANLANFLWDGERITIVDFEDSGRSERALELADLVEHVSAWLEAGLDADSFCARFGLSGPELDRLLVFRRLAALHWLLILRPGGPSQARNPPGTSQRQAARLLDLLADPG